MELSLKPTSAKVKDYYNALNQFGQLNISHETAVRQAFASLLDTCARQFKWKLVQELRISATKNRSVIVDGAVFTDFNQRHGYWEAKDLKDDLEKEAKKKLELGYPRDNIIFQSPERAILYQNGARQGLNEDITSADNLVELLKRFFSYRKPEHKEWENAVKEFAPRIPEIAQGAKEILDKERKKNREFIAAFDSFVQLCHQAINPNLSVEAVETMLIQHLLTERIFRKVFDNPEFTRRNIIAIEIEKVIKTITDKRFSRDEFLKDLDYFYRAIEDNARNATDFSEKQSFLNTVYERFFQGFSPKQADTHGIVYTPQPIVNFMVRSVEEILKKEFGKSLGDREVHILDPFVGTGNFIVRVMQEIPKTRLQYKYENELHCNEVMLLPYYIASMNIEHAYLDATGEYKPFEGICLVDTFELAEASQGSLFTAANTERVERQKKAPIFVIIGNPPYNVGQEYENENNKNRPHPEIDKRIRSTYAKDSKATLLNSLADPYVKAIRWASDRIGEEGVVALVTNNGFVDGLAADGMRKHLAEGFSQIYVMDLGGNVRKNPKLSGSTHNVFGIQIGVSINIFVRSRSVKKPATIRYARLDEYFRKEQKYTFLDDNDNILAAQMESITPDKRHRWLTSEATRDFDEMMNSADLESSESSDPQTCFRLVSSGVQTNRDVWACSFQPKTLQQSVSKLIKTYNFERLRWHSRAEKDSDLDSFVESDDTKISWSADLKKFLRQNIALSLDAENIRETLFRPYSKMFVYFDEHVTERRSRFPRILPTDKTSNVVICVSRTAERPFNCIATNLLPNRVVTGGFGSASQCLPFYTYDEDGTNRHENITDWALDQFRSHYKDKSITKWDIFYYTYAVLHHPDYRARYAANLKRELPRIPYAPDYKSFAKAGKRLAELHVDYEKQKEYPLERREKPGEKLNLRVEKMRLSKDKQTLVYNDFLTLTGIPKETYDYRLGNRSALEWVIDQYQVSTDKRSGITNDPNRDDDKEYILRLIGQVITVSLETVKIVNALPDLGLPKDANAKATTVQ